MNRRSPSIQWGARCLPRGGGDLRWAADQADNPAADDASAGVVAAMKGPSHVPLHSRGSIKTNLLPPAAPQALRTNALDDLICRLRPFGPAKGGGSAEEGTDPARRRYEPTSSRERR